MAMNAAEAVYGFAAWLTTRDAETVMSAHHDSARIAELVTRFCDTNELGLVSDNWPAALVMPEEVPDGDSV